MTTSIQTTEDIKNIASELYFSATKQKYFSSMSDEVIYNYFASRILNEVNSPYLPALIGETYRLCTDYDQSFKVHCLLASCADAVTALYENDRSDYELISLPILLNVGLKTDLIKNIDTDNINLRVSLDSYDFEKSDSDTLIELVRQITNTSNDSNSIIEKGHIASFEAMCSPNFLEDQTLSLESHGLQERLFESNQIRYLNNLISGIAHDYQQGSLINLDTNGSDSLFFATLSFPIQRQKIGPIDYKKIKSVEESKDQYEAIERTLNDALSRLNENKFLNIKTKVLFHGQFSQTVFLCRNLIDPIMKDISNLIWHTTSNGLNTDQFLYTVNQSPQAIDIRMYDHRSGELISWPKNQTPLSAYDIKKSDYVDLAIAKKLLDSFGLLNTSTRISKINRDNEIENGKSGLLQLI